MPKHRFIALLSCFILLSGCTLIPKMETSNQVLPDTYPEEIAYNEELVSDDSTKEKLSQISWQSYYQDETLQGLIETGLDNNRDLKEAALRIAEARATYGIERSALFPDIDADGVFRRQKSDATGNAAGAGGTSFIFQDYEVNLGITAYEIDFFGRIRSLKEAALNEYLATKAAHQTVRTALIADIATAYITLRSNQALLKLARDTLVTRQESYDLIHQRAKEGVATDLELTQAETLLQQARVDLYEFINVVAQDKNRLRLLLGTPKEMPSLGRQNSDNKIDAIISDVPVGLPSMLLTSRPDIMAAEYRLYSANADIGAARAAFFPRIALTATGGFSSSEFSDLFENTSRIWTFSPQINLPIFTGGRLSNNLELSEVRKEIAVVDYERTIETAFREVADALSAVSTLDDQLTAQQNLVRAAARREDLSQKRYEAGIESYLAVLDAKRELYEAKQNEILLRRQQAANRIALYKSLGGGRNSIQDHKL